MVFKFFLDYYTYISEFKHIVCLLFVLFKALFSQIAKCFQLKFVWYVQGYSIFLTEKVLGSNNPSRKLTLYCVLLFYIRVISFCLTKTIRPRFFNILSVEFNNNVEDCIDKRN